MTEGYVPTSRKMLPRWVTHALLLPAHKIYTISLYLLNIFDILGLQYHHIQWINPYILSGSLINSRSYSFDTNVNTGLPLPPDHIYTISLYLLNIFDILGLQYPHIQWINLYSMSGSLINSRSYSFDIKFYIRDNFLNILSWFFSNSELSIIILTQNSQDYFSIKHLQ